MPTARWRGRRSATMRSCRSRLRGRNCCCAFVKFLKEPVMKPYVLIVDDEADVRRLMRRMLETSGVELREAATAEEAIDLVDAAPPAVVFCDVHMPGANGLWLCDQIRSASPGTAMVLATGDADVPAAESFRSGIVAYLVKPLQRRDVVAALEEGLQWSRHAPQRPARPRVTRQLAAARAEPS